MHSNADGSRTQPAGGQVNPAPFRVLIVCTANLCRSPMAEVLLRSALSASLDWQVASAGVAARRGKSMHPLAHQVLDEHGLDGSGFRSRPLQPAMLREADLVLTATREHRGKVVQAVPAVVNRTFTINQFAHLLGDGADALHARDGAELVHLARMARSRRPARTTADDVADPVGKPLQVFRSCADVLNRAVATIARAI